MDYTGVIAEAWSITRRSRTLRVLGLISAAQIIVYAALVWALIIPIVVVPRVMSAVGAAASAPGGLGSEAAVEAMGAVGQRILDLFPLITAGFIGILALWVVTGVFDVAGQAGMIAEVDAQLAGESAPVRERLAGGFAIWWRTAGLLAIAALPSLVSLFAMAVSSTITFTLPVMRGAAPNATAFAAGQLATVPLQNLASLVAIPLSVVVALALRPAVLHGEPWKVALRSGWTVFTGSFVPVALTFLIATLISAAGWLAVSLLVGVVIALLAAAAAGVLMSGATLQTALLVAVPIGAIVVLGISLAYGAYFTAWYSALLTIVWRRVTAGTDELPEGAEQIEVHHVAAGEPDASDRGANP